MQIFFFFPGQVKGKRVWRTLLYKDLIQTGNDSRVVSSARPVDTATFSTSRSM